MDRFQYKGEFPDEVRPAVEKIVSRYEYLLPSWCHHVEVYWDAEATDGNIAYCHAKYEYRLATIVIGPLWLNRTQEDRERAVEHELNHLPTFPLVNWIEAAIARIITKEDYPALQAELLESLRVLRESVTCDLVDIMRRAGITPPASATSKRK